MVAKKLDIAANKVEAAINHHHLSKGKINFFSSIINSWEFYYILMDF